MIELENITKIYRTGKVEVPTIRGITLNIKQGEMVALIGTSDSGKSTLMNIVGFLDKPTLGRYILDGVDVTLSNFRKEASCLYIRFSWIFSFFGGKVSL